MLFRFDNAARREAMQRIVDRNDAKTNRIRRQNMLQFRLRRLLYLRVFRPADQGVHAVHPPLALVHRVHQSAAAAAQVTDQLVRLSRFHEPRRTLDGCPITARVRQRRAQVVQAYAHCCLAPSRCIYYTPLRFFPLMVIMNIMIFCIGISFRQARRSN